MSGKAGILHLHVGDGARGLGPVRDALDRSEIPAAVFHPDPREPAPRRSSTRRSPWPQRGCTIDLTAFPVAEDEDAWSAADGAGALPGRRAAAGPGDGELRRRRLPPGLRRRRAGGGDGRGRARGRRAATRCAELLAAGQPLERVLPRVHRRIRPGCCCSRGRGGSAVGADADLVVLDEARRDRGRDGAGAVARAGRDGRWCGGRSSRWRCHPERSEGDHGGHGPLRCAQGDTASYVPSLLIFRDAQLPRRKRVAEKREASSCRWAAPRRRSATSRFCAGSPALCGGRERAGSPSSRPPRSWPRPGRRYEELFHSLGVKVARSLPIASRADCERREWLDVLDEVEGVFLTGGNQLRLSTMIGGTEVAKALRRRNREGVHVAGTSAGAAFLCEHMIAFGKEGASPRAKIVTLAAGPGSYQPGDHRPTFPTARPAGPAADRAGLQSVRHRDRAGREHGRRSSGRTRRWRWSAAERSPSWIRRSSSSRPWRRCGRTTRSA